MKISEAESQVLEVFWEATHPLAAEDVVAALENDREWSPGTIRTFLTRLVKKKALAAKPDGRRYLYRPLLRREDYVHQQSRNLIDRLFGGRIAPFVTQFSERGHLSREEVEELKRLVQRLERGR
jgi:predicted transcriptional regulator